MRAVDLIPADQRRARGAGGRSGGGAYVVLGVLGVLLLAVTVLVLAGNRVDDRRAELARVTEETTVARAEAARLEPYVRFARLKETRVDTVRRLAESRFDWEHAFADLSRVLPRDVSLTQLVGTVAPGVGVGSSGAGNLRGRLAVPAIELDGCAGGQAEVARLMTRLKLVDGVTRVSLGTSEKGDTDEGGQGQGGPGVAGDCRAGDRDRTQFSVVAFFEGAVVAPPSSSGGGGEQPQEQGSGGGEQPEGEQPEGEQPQEEGGEAPGGPSAEQGPQTEQTGDEQ